MPLNYRLKNVAGQLLGIKMPNFRGAIELAPSDHAAPHEAHLLHLDCAKAARVLGWRARLDVDATARWTAAWYRAWHADGAAACTSRSQITEYQRL